MGSKKLEIILEMAGIHGHRDMLLFVSLDRAFFTVVAFFNHLMSVRKAFYFNIMHATFFQFFNSTLICIFDLKYCSFHAKSRVYFFRGKNKNKTIKQRTAFYLTGHFE